MSLDWKTNPFTSHESHVDLLAYDGKRLVGRVEQFFENGPAYANIANRRSGAMDDVDAAKRWVERNFIRVVR